uniref:Uncharacterized protein n=1 Tax=Larimichthys crocea TaxID=215358 RepID=A0A0F8CF56_LARCR
MEVENESGNEAEEDRRRDGHDVAWTGVTVKNLPSCNYVKPQDQIEEPNTAAAAAAQKTHDTQTHLPGGSFLLQVRGGEKDPVPSSVHRRYHGENPDTDAVHRFTSRRNHRGAAQRKSRVRFIVSGLFCARSRSRSVFTRLQQRGEAGEEEQAAGEEDAVQRPHGAALREESGARVAAVTERRSAPPPPPPPHPAAPTSTSTDGVKPARSCRAPSGGSAHTCPHLPTPDLRGLYDVGHPLPPNPSPPPSLCIIHPAPPPITASLPASHHAGGDEAAGEVPEEADHGADPGRGLCWRGGGQGERGDRGVPPEGQPVPGRTFLQGDVTGERPGS